MFSLAGKIALVTGGSRGIGRGCSVALAAHGAHVVVGYASNEAAARETVQAIQTAGGKAEPLRIDIGETAAAESAIADIAKRLGSLDVLVANAGMSLDGLLVRLKDEDLRRTLAVNLEGSIACARAAIRPMMKAKNGRIVFMSSVVGETGNAGQTSYAASKAALLGVTKSLAREYASRNITVNAVTPGFIETDMTRALTDAQREANLVGVPLGRVGSAEEVAAAVVFLASPEAGYVTGHVLRVNGGMYM